jgi:hypothetical protein
LAAHTFGHIVAMSSSWIRRLASIEPGPPVPIPPVPVPTPDGPVPPLPDPLPEPEPEPPEPDRASVLLKLSELPRVIRERALTESRTRSRVDATA